MTSEELKHRIEHLTIWKKKDERAPHKPLLLLFALAQLQNSKKSVFTFSEVKGPLIKLLQDFGPPRKSYHPEEPFSRLPKDGIWTVENLPAGVSVSSGWLTTNNISGGFTDEVKNLLTGNPILIKEIAEILLFQHFPETLHEDILLAIGLDISIPVTQAQNSKIKKVRSPEFRDRILKAYEYSCAVCGFNLRLGHTLVDIEAAHIKWFQSGGPDSEENGLALCSMHHKLLDRGAYTINTHRKLVVAETANGNQGFEDWLMRFHGKEIRKPIHPNYYPNESFLTWHEEQVFRKPGRYVQAI